MYNVDVKTKFCISIFLNSQEKIGEYVVNVNKFYYAAEWFPDKSQFVRNGQMIFFVVICIEDL